ncbi:BLUF domain-containing protein [Ekhidna sp.]|uniref:BLUF domain-containing protein n=1 Tax=Ekhidna sp. TaxID=2608089 RepID=UPI003C7B4D00
MIYYIIYTSTPNGNVTPEVLNDITQESIKWNSQQNITGMLLNVEDKYFQFLEGEEMQVRKLFDMIKGDSRHTNVTIRVQGYSNERVFTEWSMGSWMLTNKELIELSGLKDLKAYLDDPVNNSLQSKKFISMMSNLLQTWISHEPERAKRLKSDH